MSKIEIAAIRLRGLLLTHNNQCYKYVHHIPQEQDTLSSE